MNEQTVEKAPLEQSPDERRRLVQRGLWLNYLSLGYNAVEAVVAVTAGLLSGSVALVGFGFDSVIEVTASGAAQLRLRSDASPKHRHRVEALTGRVVSLCFIALAAYVLWDSAIALLGRTGPSRTWLGLVVLLMSAAVMPVLARAKRRVADGLSSAALRSEAKQTSLCAYLSIIALVGVALNALVGWWWADPFAALAMVPIIAKEGIESFRGRCCEAC